MWRLTEVCVSSSCTVTSCAHARHTHTHRHRCAICGIQCFDPLRLHGAMLLWGITLIPNLFKRANLSEKLPLSYWFICKMNSDFIGRSLLRLTTYCKWNTFDMVYDAFDVNNVFSADIFKFHFVLSNKSEKSWRKG